MELIFLFLEVKFKNIKFLQLYKGLRLVEPQ